MDVPDKRVRKKSKRLSESEFAPEEPVKKKRKTDKQTVPEPTASRKTLQRRKERSKAVEHHTHRAKKLIVSLKFAQHSLKLNNTSPLPDTKGRNSNSREDTPSSASGVTNGERTSPRRNVEVKFKNPKFSFSYLVSNKKKTWKNFKQILIAERSMNWRHDDPTYGSIDAPPPLKPCKKYADMSGFIAKYTDPMTGIYFNTSEEFLLIRTFPSDLIQGYLALRGKTTI